MIHYRGLGCLGVLIPTVVMFLAAMTPEWFPGLFTPNTKPLFFGGMVIVSAALVWIVGRRLNKEPTKSYFDHTTCRMVYETERHSVMGIPLESFSVVILVMAALVAYDNKYGPPHKWVTRQELEKIRQEEREAARDFEEALWTYRSGMRVDMGSFPLKCLKLLPKLPAHEQPGCLLMAMLTSYESGNKLGALHLAESLQKFTVDKALPLMPIVAVPIGATESQRLQPVLEVLRKVAVLPNATQDEASHRAAQTLLARYEKAVVAPSGHQ